MLQDKTTPLCRMSQKSSKGFTLIELLVVIAIIAVLSIVVILTLNPAELLRQARDSNRISDLATIKSAISIYLADVRTPVIASSTERCYESVLQANATSACAWFPSVAVGNTTTSINYRSVNGNGWIPISFNSISSGAPFGSLPVDPLNDINYMYTYVGSSTQLTFKVAAFMESAKYRNGGSVDVESKDGGKDINVYESGTNLDL